jgi:hypothetical protein
MIVCKARERDNFMDIEEARGRATAKLREVEDAGELLQLFGDDEVAAYPWCWVFPFNTVRWFETRRFTDGAISGPIVVNKDASETWIAPSAPPLERWLNQYGRERGYPEIEIPAEWSGSPFG